MHIATTVAKKSVNTRTAKINFDPISGGGEAAAIEYGIFGSDIFTLCQLMELHSEQEKNPTNFVPIEHSDHRLCQTCILKQT